MTDVRITKGGIKFRLEDIDILLIKKRRQRLPHLFHLEYEEKKGFEWKIHFAAKRRKFFLPIRSSTFCTNTLLHNTTTFHLASKSQILLNTNRKNNSLYIFPPSELKKIHRYSNRPSKDTRDTRMDIASTLTSGSKIGKSSWGGNEKRTAADDGHAFQFCQARGN